MKKIGLCVCYDTKNFGSQLQVLATQKSIDDLGYDYEIIRYKKKATPGFVIKSLPRLFNPYFVRNKLNKRAKNKAIKSCPQIYNQVKVRNQRFDKFVDANFKKLSGYYNGYAKLKEGASNYDAVLSGSDQLWLPSNLGSHFYTQEFVPDDIPKIAYATSFGVSEVPWYQKGRTKRYLERFKALSTREQRGLEIIKDLADKDAKVVCDPTLLFGADKWSELIKNKKVIDDKYIFCYFLGTNLEHRKIANELKEKTGLKIVTCPFLDHFVEEDKEFGDNQMFDMDSADFVNLIRHAEYVITDSFHGSIFSILHHKKFMILDRFKAGSKNSRNSRIESLCNILQLTERRYKSNIYDSICKEIDYRDVEEKLEELRKDSIKYLEDALKEI